MLFNITTHFRRLLCFLLSLTVMWPIGPVLDKYVDKDQIRQTGYYGLMDDTQPASNNSVSIAEEKIGGFAKGVCHPEFKYADQMKEANIGWLRFGLSWMPLDADGNETPHYKAKKAEIKYYHDRGFKILLTTPKPKDFFEEGINVTTEEGKKELARQSAYITKDLQGLVQVVQIANELSLSRFRRPLSFEQAVEFIGDTAKAMNETKGDILVGTNCCGPAVYPLLDACMPYNDYFDYWGMDMYLGCFDEFTKSLAIYDICINCIWNKTGKPVMVNEFGYIGYGAPKTQAEKNAILMQYGYANEEEAKKDIRGFVKALPESFQQELNDRMLKTDEEYIDALFNSDLTEHIYKEMNKNFGLPMYPHTPQGQADCIRDSVRRFVKNEHCIGCFAYQYNDSDACYICEQPDCPVETGWGLVDLNGTPKPAYYALQQAYGEISADR